MRLERRTSKDSSSRLVPVLILGTHNQTNYKYWPKFVQTDNASTSIKTVIACVLYTVKLATQATEFPLGSVTTFPSAGVQQGTTFFLFIFVKI